MSKRVRHPAVSFAMFLLVCGVGFAIWENRDELLRNPEQVILESDVREAIEDEILEAFEDDMCFFSLRGHINWRPNEGRYRLDVELEDGAACESRAKSVCEHVAAIVSERTGRSATVIAFDHAGREIGRIVL